MANNIYQKLIDARKQFLDKGVQKTGKNMSLQFKYFELADIVPTVTSIFKTLGLVAITSFTKEVATMTIVNCDNPDERIEFTSPMKELTAIVSNKGNVVMNEIQTLGSLETYQRRYLYLIAMDIVESDGIDSLDPNAEPPKKEKKTATPKKTTPTSSIAASPVTTKDEEPKKQVAPPTVDERKKIKKDAVAENGQANDLQIKALKGVLKKLKEIDPTQEEFIGKVVLKTKSFTKITKKACEILIVQVNNLINEILKDKEDE